MPSTVITTMMSMAPIIDIVTMDAAARDATGPERHPPCRGAILIVISHPAVDHRADHPSATRRRVTKRLDRTVLELPCLGLVVVAGVLLFEKL
jgi:hypothetical protein